MPRTTSPDPTSGGRAVRQSALAGPPLGAAHLRGGLAAGGHVAQGTCGGRLHQPISAGRRVALFAAMPKTTPAAAATELAARDAAMGAVIDAVGPPDLRRPPRTPFEALARAICFQQLSGKAASTIFGRFVDVVGGALTPEAVLAAPVEDLRRAGLSAAKAASVVDLAEKVLDGTVPVDRLSRLGDDDLIERLVVVRGIGR